MEVYIAYNPSIVALNATAYVRRGTLVALLGASTALASWFYLIPAFGAMGVMMGLMFGYGVILVGVAHYARILLGGVSPQAIRFAGRRAVPPVPRLPFKVRPPLVGLPLFLLYNRREVREGISLLRSFRGRGP